MSASPARGPLGPGPLSSAAGISIFELLLGMTTLAGLLAIATPGVVRLRQEVSLRSAVHETSVAFYLARSYAISKNRNVGLKFRKNGDRYEWALYADGNGNGVRTAEIASGVDRFLGVTYPWTRNDVRPGIMTGTRVPDPSSPGHYLDRVDDPIRFNSSDICSFTAMGDATPGSVYLWDAHDGMAVLRVFGATAKVRSLYYRRGERGWTP
ncbi:MAG TPA: GspH/FimT family pseudopilin [Thermoanaerobaculia bacterium]|nr:GspH/FimT family pseudopilin [Thermoanaerobaculia bacterium]